MTKSKVIPTKALPRSRKSEKTKSRPVTFNLVTTKNPKIPSTASYHGTPRGVIVKNFELSKRLTSSAASTSKFYINLNPGDLSVFPWLAIIAKGFEKFRIHKLKVHYVHTCPATEKGQYCMYFDYDSRDSAVTDMSIALQNYDRIDGASYVDKILTYKKSLESLKSYYIQKVVTPSESWIVDETPAKLNILTADGVNNELIGNVFLDYEIELMAPSIDVGSSSTSLVVKPQNESTTGFDLRHALLNSVAQAIPGVSLESTGVSLRSIPKILDAVNLQSHQLGIGNSVDGITFTDTNFTLAASQGIPPQSAGTVRDWMNSGTFARQLLQNIVIPPRSTAYIDLMQYFSIDGDEFDLDVNDLVPYLGTEIRDGLGALVSSAWTSITADLTHGLVNDRFNWRLTALVQNPNDFATGIIAGIRSYSNAADWTGINYITAAMVGSLTPYLFDYSTSSVQGGGFFSRTAKNFLNTGLITLDEVSRHRIPKRQRPDREPNAETENCYFKLDKRPAVLKTPENFRDHTSKFQRD